MEEERQRKIEMEKKRQEEMERRRQEEEEMELYMRREEERRKAERGMFNSITNSTSPQRKAEEMQRERMMRLEEARKRAEEEAKKKAEEEERKYLMELESLVQSDIQSATTNDYKLIISNWMRLNKCFESESIVYIVSKWITASKIFSIQNLWKGPTENRYAMYISYNKSDFSECNQPVLSSEKHFWKQIPILLSETFNKRHKTEPFCIQNVETGKYFCHALQRSNKIELYDEKEIKLKRAKKIICVLTNICVQDEEFVYDKKLIATTFYLRDYKSKKHISFVGCGISFYDSYNKSDLVPWLCQYVLDEKIETNIYSEKRINVVSKWLQNVGCDEYKDNFIQNGFDRMEFILVMNENDLKQIGIEKIGHRMLLKQKIQTMRNEAIRVYATNLDLKSDA